MGYPTDIFLNEPADTCICAVCHDVLKEASSLSCGHSFCTECIDSLYLMDSPSCPTCRADITSSNPNYAVRGIIDSLEVSCPDGGGECGWLGKVGELESHSRECLYKVIECGIEGCTHTCQRKDMAAQRSSNEALLQHMELKYERKMNEMEAKLSLRYDRKISELGRKIDELEDTHERENDDRKAEIQSCKKKLRSYKNKVDTLEEKVEVLEKQIGDNKKRKKMKQTQTKHLAEDITASAINKADLFDYSPLDKVVFSTTETMGAGSIDGVHINRITTRIVAEGYNEVDIKSSINKLCNWGLIYNTIDENLFQSSEEGYLSVLNDTTLRVINAYSARSNYDGSGVHINRIIADVSALGFNAGDIKDAINYLRNKDDSSVYTTIDENTFAHY